MDPKRAATWTPPDHWQRLTVIESHTGGEPLRVVVAGLPEMEGETVLERRRFAMDHLDEVRRLLMWEPRGHPDMYGAWIGPPSSPGSDFSVLFTHNAGFSTMCGHGIIALAKVVIDTGMIKAESPLTTLRIDTPAGTITAVSDVEDGEVASTRFRNVASFTVELDATLDVPGLGGVTYDLAFGGAFYAYVRASDAGVDLGDVAALVSAGRLIKKAMSSAGPITHPVLPDLGFLYGVIFTGPAHAAGNHSRNVCVFADGEVDRSPTGTGVSGLLAILHRRGSMAVGEAITIESAVGSEFTGRVVDTARVGEFESVIPEIAGSAHITGRSEFWVDPSDVLGRGFLLR